MHADVARKLRGQETVLGRLTSRDYLDYDAGVRETLTFYSERNQPWLPRSLAKSISDILDAAADQLYAQAVCDLVCAAREAMDLGKLCFALSDLNELLRKNGLSVDIADHGLDISSLPIFGPDTDPLLRSQCVFSWGDFFMLVQIADNWTLVQRPDYQASKFVTH